MLKIEDSISGGACHYILVNQASIVRFYAGVLTVTSAAAFPRYLKCSFVNENSISVSDSECDLYTRTTGA